MVDWATEDMVGRLALADWATEDMVWWIALAWWGAEDMVKEYTDADLSGKDMVDSIEPSVEIEASSVCEGIDNGIVSSTSLWEAKSMNVMMDESTDVDEWCVTVVATVLSKEVWLVREVEVWYE